MQAQTSAFSSRAYIARMPPGRPTTHDRTAFGERIAAARNNRGWTQQQLAEKIQTTQRVISSWEHKPVALRVDQIMALANALDVSTDYLLGRQEPKTRGKGPTGKVRQLFEAVSKLPRHQQEKIFDLLEPFVREHLAPRHSEVTQTA